MNFFKKHVKLIIVLIFVITLICIAVLGFILFKKVNGLQTFENDYYTIKHEKKWKIVDNKNNIELLYNDIKININLVEISNDQRNMLLNDLFDELIYDIEKTNENYKLINYNNNSNTLYNYEGNQYLFVDNDEEVLVVLLYYEGSIIQIEYKESKEMFDYYLDDVLNIIWSITIK